MRRISMVSLLAGLLLCTAALALKPQPADVAAALQVKGKPNVLFIAVDDLNHWVDHLGRNKQVITPNIDRLAKMGVTFSNAYCAAPICNPSRAALMSGLRPSTTGVYDNNVDWRPIVSQDLTLVTHMRRNGYGAFGAGKIYHGGFDRKAEWDDYHLERGSPCKLLNDTDGVGGIRFSPLDCGDEGISDYGIASYGVEQLQRKHDKPFFLAIGFHKPHMPWNVPKKYFDLYPLDKIELPPYREDDLKDIPPAGVKMARGPGSNSPDKPSDHELMLQSGRWKEAVQAYLATITYVDGQIGRLLDALDKSAYKDNTIIVFWGDHGWHLGRKASLAQIRAVGGTDARAVHLGCARRHESRDCLRAHGGFHERLSDAVRTLRFADSESTSKAPASNRCSPVPTPNGLRPH